MIHSKRNSFRERERERENKWTVEMVAALAEPHYGSSFRQQDRMNWKEPKSPKLEAVC
jgi:hypothetical protein